MPKLVEIDETELLRSQQLRQTVEKILAHPEGRELVERAHKLVDPNAKTPALDAKKAVIEPIDEVKKQLADFIKAQNESNEKRDAEAKRIELKSRFETGIATLRQRGWTDEGIKAVEKLAEEKGLLDPLDAADIYEKRNPPPIPSTPTGGAWNFPEVPSAADANSYEKALLESKGQNDIIAEREALAVLNEIRGASRR